MVVTPGRIMYKESAFRNNYDPTKPYPVGREQVFSKLACVSLLPKCIIWIAA